MRVNTKPSTGGGLSSVDQPEGFEGPVNLSLTQPVLMGGVPRPFAIVNGTLTAALTLGLHVWWLGLPLGLLLHAGAVRLTQADPLWFDVFKRQLRCPKHMEG